MPRDQRGLRFLSPLVPTDRSVGAVTLAFAKGNAAVAGDTRGTLGDLTLRRARKASAATSRPFRISAIGPVDGARRDVPLTLVS